MKLIPLSKAEKYDARTLIKEVMENSPQEALTPDKMRLRIKVLDTLDAAGGESMLLEDAEHAILSQAITTYPYNLANRDILRVIDDVANAKDPAKDS